MNTAFAERAGRKQQADEKDEEMQADPQRIAEEVARVGDVSEGDTTKKVDLAICVALLRKTRLKRRA
jgi:hypothetical protein